MHIRIHLAIALAFMQSSISAATLGEITERALANNPDVRARLHEFLSSTQDQAAARGGLFPRVNLEAYYGRERQESPGVTRDFNHPGASLQLRQLLFDGRATTSEIRRLGHAKATRYYQFLATTDEVALETVRAYLDVQRYRQLTDLAQENWAVHREIYEQIEQRVSAGVGRRVDLEQAAGRLALAQSNWLTESSNLHDVSARFERIVGERPPALVPLVSLAQQLPSEKEVLQIAVKENPNYLAAVSNLRAARAQTDVRRAANAPTLEFRASQNLERNRQGVSGSYKDSVAQVILNYNLFSGGADQARTRAAQELYNVAMDMRDKSCREIRQTTIVAWNDLRKLREQMQYLEQHLLSTEKARDAYRQQFDIGQRTLLDVLDTENELFEARRAFAAAENEFSLAEYRILASTHRLLSALGLGSNAVDRPDEAQDTTEDMVASRCDATMPIYSSLDTAAAMAARPQRKLPTFVPAPITPAPSQSALAAPSQVSPPTKPANTTSGPNIDDATVENTVRAWVSAWTTRNTTAYLNFYSTDFSPLTVPDKAGWRALRVKRLSKPSTKVTIENLKLTKLAPDLYEASFLQHYRSNDYNDDVPKTLTFKKEGTAWRIIKEVAPPSGTN